MAKLLASEASWQAANACLDTHGGYGFAAEYDVERKFRETRLYSVAPVSNEHGYLTRGGRFGAHNLHENHEQPTCASLQNTTLGTYFNGGVRVFDIRDAYRPEEIAYFVPKKHPGSHLPTSQINDVFVVVLGVVALPPNTKPPPTRARAIVSAPLSTKTTHQIPVTSRQ